jgi:hypothetical protein
MPNRNLGPDELHREVCSGNLSLEAAQREIASDWYKGYVTSVPRN